MGSNDVNTELWDTSKEDLLKEYAIESECMYITYIKEYKKYRWYGYLFTIPGIIISTVTGLLSFDNNFDSSSDGPFVIGGLNILVAVIGTIYKVLKYADLENQFRFLSGEHLKLYADIQSALAKSPGERDNALEFIRKIETRRMQLIDDAPVVSTHTKKDFRNKYAQSKIQIPLMLNKLNPIKIYGREVDSEVISLDSDLIDGRKKILDDNKPTNILEQVAENAVISTTGEIKTSLKDKLSNVIKKVIPKSVTENSTEILSSVKEAEEIIASASPCTVQNTVVNVTETSDDGVKTVSESSI